MDFTNKRYNNYHKHTHYSNIRMGDSPATIEDYCERIKELGHTTYFTTEHEYGGDVHACKSICDKYNVKCVFALEGYICKNNRDEGQEKRNQSYHIMIIAKNDKARKKLNLLISDAEINGFYNRGRIDLPKLLEFNKEDIYITTACIAGILKDQEAIDDIFIPLFNKFKENILLEVQCHTDEKQKEINKLALEFKDKYKLKIVASNDSHYIYEHEKENRKVILLGKGISYGNEDDYILDYPDYKTWYERFKKQGILKDEEIIEAIDNTLIFDNCEEIILNKVIKMPNIYKNLNTNERHELLFSKIKDNFKKIIVKDKITKEEFPTYWNGIKEEFNTILNTSKVHTADYFLLNEKLIKLAKEKYGGILTNTSRGCFTKDALILTKKEYKTIDKVEVGDVVLSSDGKWNRVLDTQSYFIEEDMIEFQYHKQGSLYNKYKNVCTLDHKILVHRNNKNKYIKADELKIGDLLCSPKIKHEENKKIIYDLNDFNEFGYDYDDNYIYEKVPVNNDYLYSPAWMYKNNIVSNGFCCKIKNNNINLNSIKTKKCIDKILSNTPFKTIENYRNYLLKNGYSYRAIPRFIKLDSLLNIFIGMMYGDGWTHGNNGLGLAINSTTKNNFNRKIFYKIANKFNLEVKERNYIDKDLTQMYLTSHILNKWFECEFFKSFKGKEKKFNPILLSQNENMLKCIYMGMLKTDGSKNINTNKISFSSISLSLISTFNILDNIVNKNIPNALDVRGERICNRGYINQESYSLRREISQKRNILKQDENFYYLPITKIINHKKKNTKVYDLTIENNPSYTINNIIVHNSMGSFYINRVLELTQLDRFKTTLPLYPDRFLSVARAIESNSLPDCDFNTSNQEPFMKASKELLGEDGCYFMMAYGTMQESESFRNICRSKDMKMAEFNDIGKDLEKYSQDDKWKPIIEESKKYIGTIISASVHPCSALLMDKDIKEEVGVLKIGDAICAILTSEEADEWKYLKNDYLIVSVWELIARVFEKINKPILSLNELKEVLDDKTYDIYKNGLTCTINQADSDYGTQLAMKYNPRTPEEFAKYTGAVRPNFEAYRNQFISREPYSSGVPQMDDLFNATDHFIIFQENLMQWLIWLGETPSSAIVLIKKISKKSIKHDDFDKLEQSLRSNWIKNIGNDNDFDRVWHDMQNMMNYGFNCVSGDTIIRDNYLNGLSVEDMYTFNQRLGLKKGNIYGFGFSLNKEHKITINKIVDIKYAGIKDVYKVTTTKGKYIKCTMNHKFPIPISIDRFKYVPLEDMHIGDYIYVQGEYINDNESLSNLEKIVSIEYVGVERTYDVAMDRPNHNFVVNNGIVTANSPHALSYAYDSLYTAYLKSHYPLEYYTIAFDMYNGDIPRTKKLTKELEYFKINLKPIQFRYSRYNYNDDKETNSIYKGVGSIKYLNNDSSEELYEIGQTFKGTFYDLLSMINKVDDRQMQILITLDYFKEFGKSKKVLTFYDYYSKFKNKKQFSKNENIEFKVEYKTTDKKNKTYRNYNVPISLIGDYCERETEKQYSKFNDVAFLDYIWNNIENKDLPLAIVIKAQDEFIGGITYTNPKLKSCYMVTDFKVYENKLKPYITLYSLEDGSTIKTNTSSNTSIYAQKPFNKGSFIKVLEWKEEYKKRMVVENGRKTWVSTNDKKEILIDWNLLG